MSNDEKRTIGDVLLSIEEKIINLTKSIALSDQTIKIVLNKLNDLNVNRAPVVMAPPPPQPPKSDNERVIPSQQQFSLSEKPRESTRKQIDLSAEKMSPLMKDPQVTKIPVQQRVIDQNNKDVFMAEVVIKDRDTSDVMHKVKTNATGRWQAYLPIGSYLVKISKTSNETKEKMEFFQEFEVKADKKSLELSEFKINK